MNWVEQETVVTHLFGWDVSPFHQTLDNEYGNIEADTKIKIILD